MVSVGVLLADLAKETGGGVFDRVWPFFLAIVVLMAVGAAVLALKGAGRGEEEPSDEE